VTDEERFEAGLHVRREVLGNDYVNRSLASATEFSRPFQDLVSRYCWGDIWCRPGLDRKQRSIVNLSMIAALNRPHELKLHVKGALNNGMTRDEIREVFMQVAVYCGIPAGLDSFRLAQEVFAEIDKAASDPQERR
jgi:4-carboxymuconolactone decarboxylase